jgi:hypothetical protein
MFFINVEVERKRRKDYFFFLYYWIEKEEEEEEGTVNVYLLREGEREQTRKSYESMSEPISISQSYKHTHHIDD